MNLLKIFERITLAYVEIALDTQTNSCFVIMPFKPSFSDVYQRVIKPAVEETGLTCIRADEIYSKPHVMSDIWKFLRSSRIVIAELTDKNPNVLYELGLAHSLGKPTIIITRNSEDVPFDLQALRYLQYNIEDPFWGGNLRTALASMIRQVVEDKTFGTVFDNITVKGNTTPEDIKPETVENEVVFDLSGKWKGIMDIGLHTIKKYDLDLVLNHDQSDNSLSGTMMIEFDSASTKKTVKESMKGQVEDEDVTLYGTTVSIIKQAGSLGYNLDNFSLIISSDRKTLEGTVVSDEAKGTAKFEKI